MKSLLVTLCFTTLLVACGSVDVTERPTTTSSTTTSMTTTVPLPLVSVVRGDVFADMPVPYAFGPPEPSMQLQFTSTNDATLTGLTLKDAGVGAWTDVDLVTINDGAQQLSAQIDTQTGLVHFADLTLAISPSLTAHETVLITYFAPKTSAGNQHRFEVESVGDLTFDREVDVNASFPIVGVTQTISDSPNMVFSTTYVGAPTSVQGCGVYSLFRYDATSLGDLLEIHTQRFRIESTDGGMVRGSNGTSYFTNMRLQNISTGQTMMGPIEFDPTYTLPSATVVELPFGDFFNIGAFEVMHLEVVATIACTEDAAGELFGHSYRVVKYPVNGTEILDMTVASPVPLDATWPTTEMVGGTFTVTP